MVDIYIYISLYLYLYIFSIYIYIYLYLYLSLSLSRYIMVFLDQLVTWESTLQLILFRVVDLGMILEKLRFLEKQHKFTRKWFKVLLASTHAQLPYHSDQLGTQSAQSRSQWHEKAQSQLGRNIPKKNLKKHQKKHPNNSNWALKLHLKNKTK